MKPKLLIADDEVNVLESMRRMLESYFDITTVTSGSEAVRICDREQFEAAIIDVRFDTVGGISGIEAAERIRKKNRELKIILFSAHYSERERGVALDLGATFLEKTIQIEDIFRVLEPKGWRSSGP